MHDPIFGIATTPAQRCLVMGIVNVTKDSFSDGGKYLDIDAAIKHAHELVAAGADIIDVGGESTRPGATRVDAQEEQQRVVPVIQALAQEGIITSVDTMRAQVAAAAAEAGVHMINDVSGGLADTHMYRVMADTGLPVCLMHWKTVRFGDAAGRAIHEGGVVADVHTTLRRLVDNALAAGVKADAITLDPGLGFAKTAEDNWQLLHALPEFIAGDYPILVGASRKRFLAQIRAERGVGGEAQQDIASTTDPATAAVTAIAAQMGAWCVRVHDVAPSRDAVDVAARWRQADTS
ncbi:dihydropteroate synthase [Corynebacterium sp. sy017]|uniref:dihydropteroate synthase n=1 Tax=unclassified Corynebacterium TaxID=2624378 RepID=UPI001186C012|nr:MULTISPECIES: dihydropteroate synthase [unclassified Corynebacterium]MBP3088565.1 dihydropteroate synthase [Corynebacterium sp. sy017]QDZ43469.1 dihydropteroate synthase [Corynebacterium sp. sy039]TSD92099.1 dihydropteroate synthase [Corynebacterium sp. SY003]